MCSSIGCTACCVTTEHHHTMHPLLPCRTPPVQSKWRPCSRGHRSLRSWMRPSPAAWPARLAPPRAVLRACCGGRPPKSAAAAAAPLSCRWRRACRGWTHSATGRSRRMVRHGEGGLRLNEIVWAGGSGQRGQELCYACRLPACGPFSTRMLACPLCTSATQPTCLHLLVSAEIEICKRPDGSDWELGTGGFGKVGGAAAVCTERGLLASLGMCPGQEAGPTAPLHSRNSAGDACQLPAIDSDCIFHASPAGVQGAAPRRAACGDQGPGGRCTESSASSVAHS